MSTPIYPEDLPIPRAFRLTPTQQVLGTDADAGPIAYRRRSRQPGATATIEFRYLRDEYSRYVEWFKSDLKYGHKWFWINLPGPNGIKLQIIRFMDKPKAVLEGHRFWTVTAQIEIRDRLVPSEEVMLLTSSPYPYMSADSTDISADFDRAWCVNLDNIGKVDLVCDFESCSLVVVVAYIDYDMQVESIDIAVDFESGTVTVTTTYESYSAQPEAVDISVDFESGLLTVTTTYVTYSNWIPEIIDLSMDFESGTLEIV